MKKYLSVIITFIFILNGCSSQTPDYLNTIAATELNQVMQNKNIFLVDVHTPEQKHIKGTNTFVPFNQIEKYINKFPTDKNTAIYLYCEGGPMGNIAAKSLYKLGYKNIYNLEGGARAWRNKGLALE
jgi:rhodanese-related sulfurtransferase